MKDRMRGVIVAADEVAGRASNRVESVIHGATGWSSYQTARKLLLVGLCLVLLSQLHVLVASHSVWRQAWEVYIIVWFLAMTRRALHMYHKLERVVQNPTAESMPLTLTEMTNLVFYRLLMFWMVIVAGWVPLLPPADPIIFVGNIGVMMMAMSGYIIVNFRSGSKSLARKALDWAKEALTVRVPIPAAVGV